VSRPEPDPIALWIAAIVQHHLITNPAERPDLPELPEGVTAVEAHAIGDLACGVVVTMAEGALRYFLVHVQEFDHR
jgi:hypothetical protein